MVTRRRRRVRVEKVDVLGERERARAGELSEYCVDFGGIINFSNIYDKKSLQVT
jgi:hypothetical protein